MCGGPTSTQQQLQQSESDFYQNQINAYNTAYSNFKDIQATLNQQFAPILAAGPGQFGFTPAETAALRTQATEGTAQGYAAAQQALQQRMATLGGGTNTINMAGGPMTQVQGQLASQAAAQQSQQQLGITTAGYQQGRANWQNAISGEQALAAGWNPNAFSGSATSAGGLASSEANTIAQQQNQMWGSVLGALGGVAGSMAGGWATGGFKLPGGGAGAGTGGGALPTGWA